MSVLTKQSQTTWQPPDTWSREQVVATSDAVLRAGRRGEGAEDIFRLSALGLDWDIGVRVYERSRRRKITRGADGNKVGIFLLHAAPLTTSRWSGSRCCSPRSSVFKVVTMTFPGPALSRRSEPRLAGRPP